MTYTLSKYDVRKFINSRIDLKSGKQFQILYRVQIIWPAVNAILLINTDRRDAGCHTACICLNGKTQYIAAVCDNASVFNLLINFPDVQTDTRLSVVMSGTSSAICWVYLCCVRIGPAFEVDDDDDDNDDDDDVSFDFF